ncbi:MAG: hypothetical protein Q7Q73_15995 [Verrucomicrobiota bacterium JB024]|nr:hypothetical protein [Verrucomicrobiota bacterium JB024]
MKALPLLLFSSLVCARLLAAEPADPPKELSLPEIMAEYLKAQGGSSYIESIETLRLEGTITQDGLEIDFVQVKKQPDLMRMTFDLGPMELIMGYNGETAWQTTRQRLQAKELTGAAKKELVSTAAMFNELYQPHNPRIKRRYLGQDEFEGTPVYLIEVTLEDGAVHRYSIDQESFLDRRLEYTQLADGVEHTLEQRYYDIRPLDKLQLPHRVESYRDGERVSVVSIDTIQVDTGVYLPYFDPPGGIEGRDELPVKVSREPLTPASGSTITGSSVLAGATLPAN